jgi:hypothetical protein
MTVCIFSGPTLSPAAAKELFPEAECLGPAVRGDVLRAVRKDPVALCLIDGYFEHTPAVSHKEIAWALTAGIPVYGAASIGALRAAELDAQGMLGHGRIYEAYAAGLLEDDDEVAVTHADESRRYAPSTEALVNLRATLQHAVEHAVLSVTGARQVLDRAKSMFYGDRTREVYKLLATEALSQNDAARLGAWLSTPDHWIDQKRLDCVSLLREVRSAYLEDRLDVPAERHFVCTTFWLSQVSDAERVDTLRDADDIALVQAEIERQGAQTACEFAATRRALCKTIARLAGSADPEDDIDAVLKHAALAARDELPAIVRKLPNYTQLLDRARKRSS